MLFVVMYTQSIEGEQPMNSQKLLKIVNSLLALTVLVQIVSIMLFSLAGIKDAIEVHGAAGLCFVVLFTAHLVLNRQWIKAAFFKGNKN